MLLGVDFFLAHHIFIANSQNKIYFTYNGGRVFSLAKAPDAVGKAEERSTDEADAPKTADDYVLRGQARLSRAEMAGAVSDLDVAIQMAPDKATSYFARARAHLGLKQADAAMADLDKAISLDPGNIEPILMRAELRLGRKDKPGAQSDIAAARYLAPAGSSQARAIADFYITADQPASALPLLDDWIRLHGEDSALGSVLNKRCWARGLANVMLNDALADCRKAIKRNGAKAGYLDSLALIHLRLKNYPQAIETYERVVAQVPRLAWSRYGLGLAKVRSGAIEAGNVDIAAAKAINPMVEEQFAKFGI